MTENKKSVLSEISRDVGQVLFASVFVGPLMSGGTSSFLIVVGLALTSFAWWLGLIAIK